MRRVTLYSSSTSRPASTRTQGAARAADDAQAALDASARQAQPAGQTAPQATQQPVQATRRTAQPTGPAAPAAAPVDPIAQPAEPAAQPLRRPPRWRMLAGRHERVALPALGALVALAGVALHAALAPVPASKLPTQKDIDAAVLRTLETKPLPSFATRAVEAVRPSVVRVRRLGEMAGPPSPAGGSGAPGAQGPADVPGTAGRPAQPGSTPQPGSAPHPPVARAAPGAAAPDMPGKPSLTEIGVGTGVVILDTGVILTNLHVVDGADRIGVVFADGTESEAVVMSVQPENDLAVIRAKTIPDDLVAATLRSTQDLAPGDAVAAVGFPFGIGPSASAGVISGLRRDYVSPAGKRILSNLIQFDAAVNPGNSGGPLVTADGEVIGIVTGLLNPTDQQVFIGIGFAVPIENAASGVGISPF